MCFNILVRAVVVAACWAILLQVGAFLNERFSTVYAESGASGRTQEIVSTLPNIYFGIVGASIMLTSVSDVIQLVIATVRPSGEGRGDRSDETHEETNN